MMKWKRMEVSVSNRDAPVLYFYGWFQFWYLEKLFKCNSSFVSTYEDLNCPGYGHLCGYLWMEKVVNNQVRQEKCSGPHPLVLAKSFESNTDGKESEWILQIKSYFGHFLYQGSPILVLKIYHPAEFSSTPNLTHLIQVIKVFWSTKNIRVRCAGSELSRVVEL